MALPVNTLLVEDSAAGLAAGGWRYTQRQLYYATCARAETTPSDAASNGEIGLGVLMLLIGLIVGALPARRGMRLRIVDALAAH